jgi:hypothetical protein
MVAADTKLVALSGFDSKPIAVKIKESSVIDTKHKVPKWQDIQHTIESGNSLKDIKGFKDIYLYKNIIPVPNALVQAYLNLSSFDPGSVALALYNTMSNNDQDTDVTITDPLATPDPTNSSETDETTPLEFVDSSITEDSDTPITRTRRHHNTKVSSEALTTTSPWFTEFTHVFHFCYLCSVGKIEPIIYSIPG